MKSDPTRRNVLKATGLAAVSLLTGLGLGGSVGLGAPAGAAPQKRESAGQPALRVAHLTDMHVQPERRAGEGLTACLRHLASQPDKPDLILTGGDLVMDAFEAGFDRTKLQWELFTRILKDECGTPVEHCLGNHDIWGWNRKKSGATGDEPCPSGERAAWGIAGG
ncbi:MAG: metallophosphoesterase [Planctomycetota bacterium]